MLEFLLISVLITFYGLFMLISAIVAISENNVIGRDGHLPWRLPT